MSVLGIALITEHIGLFRTVFVAEILLYQFTDCVYSLCCQTGGVRSHIRNQTGRTLADTDAFIQLLGHHHGPAGREVQLMGSFLLERAGGERRQRTTGNFFTEGSFHLIGRLFQIVFHCQRFPGIVHFQLIAVLFDSFRLKQRSPGFLTQLCLNRPELFRNEFINNLVPVRNDLHCHGLHTAGAQAFAHLAPKQRAQLIPYQTVNDAACLLCVHHRHVYGAGMFQRLLNRAGGDLMKLYPAGRLIVQSQDVGQMPADCFPFPVRVSCQIHFICFGRFRF